MSNNYQWLRNMMGSGREIPCPACGTPMTYHTYGAPLRVCPSCFPDEAA